MEQFKQGLAAGYTLALEDLRQAVEGGKVHKKNREWLDVLEALALDCVERWLEDSGEGDKPANA